VDKKTHQISEHWVAKAVISGDKQRVVNVISGENILAKLLPEVATATRVHGVFQRINEGQRSVFVGILLKKRVNGGMLYDIAKGQSQALMVRQAYNSLEIFRSNLIYKLEDLARSGRYISDFHADNIMYDLSEQRWYLVDANLHNSWIDFYNQIYNYNTPRNSHTAIPAIWNLIRDFKNGPPPDGLVRTMFFARYADIYLGEYLKALEQKAASSTTLH
jgi:hypothetical protein